MVVMKMLIQVDKIGLEGLEIRKNSGLVFLVLKIS
jgi:hypothetical protein